MEGIRLGTETDHISIHAWYCTCILYYYKVSVSFFLILGVHDLKEFSDGQNKMQTADCKAVKKIMQTSYRMQTAD